MQRRRIGRGSDAGDCTRVLSSSASASSAFIASALIWNRGARARVVMGMGVRVRVREGGGVIFSINLVWMGVVTYGTYDGHS